MSRTTAEAVFEKAVEPVFVLVGGAAGFGGAVLLYWTLAEFMPSSAGPQGIVFLMFLNMLLMTVVGAIVGLIVADHLLLTYFRRQLRNLEAELERLSELERRQASNGQPGDT